MTLESNVQKQILDYLESQGFLVERINGVCRGHICSYAWWDSEGTMHKKGKADVCTTAPWGQSWHVEVKKPKENGKKRTPEQLLKMCKPEQLLYGQEITKRNGFWMVTDNLQGVIDAVERSYVTNPAR